MDPVAQAKADLAAAQAARKAAMDSWKQAKAALKTAADALFKANADVNAKQAALNKAIKAAKKPTPPAHA